MKCINPIYIEKNMISVPCGKCQLCKNSYSTTWAVRVLAEVSNHKSSIFVTLTYNDEKLVKSISKKHVQDYVKRLRKRLNGRKIKYMFTGEYGEDTNRAHYHAILFNVGYEDFEYLYTNPKGKKYYKDKSWRYGNIYLGAVCFETAKYTAKYILKKYNSDEKHEQLYGKELEKPFILVSQGIGKEYAIKNKDRLLKEGSINFRINNEICKFTIPRYFIKVWTDITTREKILIEKYNNLTKEEKRLIPYIEQEEIKDIIKKRDLGLKIRNKMSKMTKEEMIEMYAKKGYLCVYEEGVLNGELAIKIYKDNLQRQRNLIAKIDLGRRKKEFYVV